MTNREAIRYLKTWRITGDRSHEALDMAISALQAQEAKNLKELSSTQRALDTVSRKAAIDAMCWACGHDCDKSKFVYNAPQDEQVIMCPEHYALSTLPSAQPEPQWIPIRKGLPKIDVSVLVTTKWNALCIAWRIGIDKWNNLDGIIMSTDDLTAWMPLPEPYRAERRTE